MQLIKTELDAVKLLTPPTLHEDFRGHYVELYNRKEYASIGIHTDFPQDDMSVSTQNVLRGIHGDGVTTKLISCLVGRIFVVVVDFNPNSPQYLKSIAVTLSEHNRLQLLVPPKHGLAHLVMSDWAIFHFKQSAYYDRASQFSLRWNDPVLGIRWPIQSPVLSDRDRDAQLLSS